MYNQYNLSDLNIKTHLPPQMDMNIDHLKFSIPVTNIPYRNIYPEFDNDKIIICVDGRVTGAVFK